MTSFQDRLQAAREAQAVKSRPHWLQHPGDEARSRTHWRIAMQAIKNLIAADIVFESGRLTLPDHVRKQKPDSLGCRSAVIRVGAYRAFTLTVDAAGILCTEVPQRLGNRGYGPVQTLDALERWLLPKVLLYEVLDLSARPARPPTTTLTEERSRRITLGGDDDE